VVCDRQGSIRHAELVEAQEQPRLGPHREDIMTTTQQDVIDRVTGYIRHNATKEPAALRALVQQGQAQLTGLLDGLSEEQAAFKPATDDWSVRELLRHVIAAKRGVARICERLAAGERIAGTGREGDEQDGMMGRREYASLAEARAALDEAHASLLAFIDGPLAAANTETRFPHFIFGELNCREWAVFQRVHDGDHANQIQQIRAAPGFPAA
jgi:hypothetical protein